MALLMRFYDPIEGAVRVDGRDLRRLKQRSLRRHIGADRILVLREGNIAESGKHTELMKLGGYYATLVRKQTSGLLQNEGEPL